MKKDTLALLVRRYQTQLYRYLRYLGLYKNASLLYRKHDPRIEERLRDHFPTAKAFWGEVLNHIFRLIKLSRSYVPQAIVIEPTNICNLKCLHCTAQNGKKRGLIEWELYRKIIDYNPQLTSVILSRNGEPFIHPKIFEMINYARQKDIYVSVYTNGILIKKDILPKIFESGLSEIIFSIDGVGETYRKIRGIDYGLVEKNFLNLLGERTRRKSGLKAGINMVLMDETKDMQGALLDAWKGRVDYINFEPLMGGQGQPRRSSCRTLWRNLVISWDGIVTPCCIDVNEELYLGNVKSASLREIFNSPRAMKLRRLHNGGDFPKICRNCSMVFG